MNAFEQAFKKNGVTRFNSIAHDVDTADKLMQELSQKQQLFRNLTTSKLRTILSMINEISNDLRTSISPTLSQDAQDKISYLRIRLAYECGRDAKLIKIGDNYFSAVEIFVEKAQLLKLVKYIGDSKDNFVAFARYMEALVAYHRFYGGKD